MQELHTNRLNPVLLWAGGIVIVLLSIWGLHSLLRDRIDIRVATVSHQDLVSTISTNGRVEPVFSFESHSPFAGTVSGVYVQQGDMVRKGKLLLTMDDEDARAHLATATSALRLAQANLEAMQNGGSKDAQILLSRDLSQAQMQVDVETRQLATLQSLLAAGSASQNEVTVARERLQTAQNNLSALSQRKTSDYSAEDLAHARAQLADAKAEYDVAQDALNETHVTAPFDGTVYSLSVNATNYVTAGQELLDVADINHLQIRAYFDEPDIGKLAEGQQVTIEWDAKPGLSWRGHVERTASDITTYGTRNVGQVLVAIDDTPGTLLPNTNVTLSVTIFSRKNVLSIPREALHTDGPDNYVYKVVDDRLSRTSVQVGAVNLVNVEILGGLDENDIVVRSSSSSEPLANGAEVHIIK
jgi:HlyD family secretion protein